MASSRWTAWRSVLFGSAAILCLAMPAAAQDFTISLKAQPLSDALRGVAQKTGESILFTPESVEGLKAPAKIGRASCRERVSPRV